MNEIMLGKLEACLELSDGNAVKFKLYTMTVTGLTERGFHEWDAIHNAYMTLQCGGSINDAVEELSK